ncbi:MAG: PilZ domain-containing protein [Myxococcales bacterium]|nr:PilZ domain-containing protein [Myxococcales bacterium]MDD9970096.1 PilZ domain-containing protein [Myxococcales bacterium]
MGHHAAVKESPEANDAPDMFQELELSLEAFPLLTEAIAKGGRRMRSELLEFAMAARWKRAPRIKRNLMARVYLHQDEIPDVAIVRDISESGVRVWVDRGCSLDAAVTGTIMEIKVPGTREYVAVTAELVRVVDAKTRRGMELAFRFVVPSPMLSKLLSSV